MNFNFPFVIFCSGYMPPEYAVHGQYSVKSDVFSFGVLVLEILSGKKNRGFCHPDHHLNLLGHVSMKKGILLIYIFKQNLLLTMLFLTLPGSLDALVLLWFFNCSRII